MEGLWQRSPKPNPHGGEPAVEGRYYRRYNGWMPGEHSQRCSAGYPNHDIR